VVARVLHEQAPELAGRPIALLGRGFDHEAYEVDGEWVVRMPMRAEVAARLPIELAAMELAREAGLALAVPEVVRRGVSSAVYPHQFCIYRKLHGIAARRLPLAALCVAENAALIGRTLSTLHRVTPEIAGARGIPREGERDHTGEGRLDAIARQRAQLDAAVGPARARRYRDLLEERPRIATSTGTFALCHADLHLEHVLVDPDRACITAVIDWGDSQVCDVAEELAPLLVACGEGFVSAILDAYDAPADAGLLDRARLRARYALLEWIGRYAERQRRDQVGELLACFDHIFPP
jgi:aminoglycoside phosphotransferase (APT) family kinase protein